MRYLITGGCGYIGSRLVERLVHKEDTEQITLADIRPPKRSFDKVSYSQCDVSSEAARSLVLEQRPDVLVHLAFILNPIHDLTKMYQVDVNGCQNVLNAATEAGIKHVLVTSSATAYGAWPDNPVPIDEEWPVRGVPQFEYARDKTESDRICQLWACRNPDAVMTIVRPTIVFGPNVDNFIVHSLENFPFMPLLDGCDPPTQFVHEDDLVQALLLLLDKRKQGAYNVAADGTLSWSECATLAGIKSRRISYKLMYRIIAGLWALRAPKVESPPGQLQFMRYPWVVSNEKLKKDTGWQPKFTSRETLEITLQARGIVSPHPSSVAQAAVPVE